MKRLRGVFEGLLDAYGPQGWWPGEGEFEIVAGAVLVHRTAWRNAAAALENLAAANLLEPSGIAGVERERLEQLIRPAGFFRVKARRLQEVAGEIVAAGGIEALQRLATPDLRCWLLGLHGIGAETADAILLYAFERPAVVVDAYLRRLVRRIDSASPVRVPILDSWIRSSVEQTLISTDELNEFHALVVEHAKRVCRSEPECADCSIRLRCDFAQRRAATAHSGDQTKPSSRR